jgi:homoserine O-acetyltransferase
MGKSPRRGLALARMIGHLTFLSPYQLDERFGRTLRQGSFERGKASPLQFEVESYLNYKGGQFAESFDANTYLLITRMLDVFDLAREYDSDPVAAFRHARCEFLVMPFTTDWRFAPARSREIVEALVGADKPVTYAEIETDRGHDGFLAPIPRYLRDLGSYLSRVAAEVERAN